MTTRPILTTERLRLDAFSEADVGALAAILAEPDVAKTITANGSTAEKCRASARHRIGWHNASWAERGYGVWAVRARVDGTLIGWCGFAAPDIGADPEILYGLAPQCWGRGLAQEMARAAIDWLFAETPHQGVSAIIFRRINAASVAVAGKLGMTKRGTMAMDVFLPEPALAREVLEYEIWRLGHGRTGDLEALLFEAPYKGGQIASLKLADRVAVEQLFCDAARGRAELARSGGTQTERRVREAFRHGLAEPWLDWFHLDREAWRA